MDVYSGGSVCFVWAGALWCAALFMRIRAWVLIWAVIGHHLLIAVCCDVLLKLGNSCIKYVCLSQSV